MLPDVICIHCMFRGLQVTTWFANARRRFYRKMRDESKACTRTKTKSEHEKQARNNLTAVHSSAFYPDRENIGAIQV